MRGALGVETRTLDLVDLICALDQLSRRIVTNADTDTLRRFRELAFNCEFLAAAELDRRQDTAGGGCTKENFVCHHLPE